MTLTIIAINRTTGKIHQTKATLEEWQRMPKRKGFWYRAFEKGFAQFKID